MPSKKTLLVMAAVAAIVFVAIRHAEARIPALARITNPALSA